jgi:hypothetical protein
MDLGRFLVDESLPVEIRKMWEEPHPMSSSKKPSFTTPKPHPAPLPGPHPSPTSTPGAGGAMAAFQTYQPLAAAVPASQVVLFRGDPNVVYTNVLNATRNLLANRTQILAELPNEDLTVFENLPQIALGLLYAALQATHRSTKQPTLQANLKEAHALRALLLSSAAALAQAGILDAAVVNQIRKGRGLLDVARDLIALAGLFNANALVIAGKTPITVDQVNRASELGTLLQGQLKPKGAPKVKPVNTAADIRDRFWALVVQHYDRVWRVGALLFGQSEVSSKIPPLLSHVVHQTVAKKAVKAAKQALKADAKASKAATRAANVKPKPVKRPKKRGKKT